MEQVFFDRAAGSICGAFTADSCGSYVEFSKRRIRENVMIETMQMMGGGSAWARIGPGQVTDDSELAQCLMHALIQSNLKG